MLMSWIVAATVGTIAYFVYDTYHKSRYWPDRGIPTLTPAPLFGSILDVLRTGLHQFDLKWTRKLERIFGYFEGAFPVVVTSDLDFGLSGPIMEHALTEIRDQHWKDIRGVLIPSSTSDEPADQRMFVKNTQQIIRLRKESKQYRRDFLQLMLSSLKSEPSEEKPVFRGTETTVQKETDADVAASALALSSSNEKPFTHSNYKLTLEELVAQSIIFFLGGYETTATTLTFMSYCLATKPEIQERLRKEIRTVLANKETIEYYDLAEMPYFDQCVNETLRLYPPISRAERQCGENWSYGGVEYEKGTVIEILIFAIHRDPEYWKQPEVYDPERFSKENRANIKPYSFMAFGQGPRNCIGMRFAYYGIKMVVASILLNYRLVLSLQTEVPLVLKDSLGFVSTEKGVWMQAQKL